MLLLDGDVDHYAVSRMLLDAVFNT